MQKSEFKDFSRKMIKGMAKGLSLLECVLERFTRY
ncbi:hypothetical protein MVUOKPPV_CDS0294 [Klebsiella phage phi1_175008]|uniref:Uncharacterized protein n=1 Tax=Klebsiella phage phi1_175008 TaxID=3127744 RepID=A0ACD5FRX6_9CAUD